MSEYIKRLATLDDKLVDMEPFISATQITERQQLYLSLSPKEFAKQFHGLWGKPVEFSLGGMKHKIQVNHCTNTFCRWFCEPQIRYQTIKHKPYRYKLHGAASGDDSSLMCNPRSTKYSFYKESSVG